MMISPTTRRSASVQIVAKRVTVVRSNRTRSGVAAIQSDAFETKYTGSSTSKPQSKMISLITAAAAAWSLMALFGHY